MANFLGEDIFSHPDTTTSTILKTNTIKTKGDIDLVEVIGNSYKEVSRVEYIPVRADNGRVYDVPVHWVEYVPLTAYNKMEIKKLDVKEDEFENYVNNEDFSKVVNNKRYGYKNNLFAVFNDEGELNCEEILSKIKK